MPQEFRFTDFAFSSEVIIRSTHAALYRTARPQFERLKKIRDLGLTGHFGETAVHTKHHHLIGLMRLFEKLLVQPEGYGLPKSFLWSFWARLCYSQTGHAAFCYDSEKAVLLACHVDNSFRRLFMDFLTPVVDIGAKCVEGQNEDEKKPKISQWLNTLVEKNQWEYLFYWVAALKLIQDQNTRGILESQHYDKGSNRPGFDWSKAILILIDPENEWNHSTRQLNRLDYVVRDLHLTGRIGVTLDVDRMVANINQPDDPDWFLIQQLDEYLKNTLYESMERQTESVLFQRTLASLLINGKIDLERLFGINPNNFFSDDDVARLICKRKQGKELFDFNVRSAWRTWTISGEIEKDMSPLILEQKLSGRRKINMILTDPSKHRLITYQLTHEKKIALSLRHRDASDRPNPSNFVHICKRIVDTMYPTFSSIDIYRALIEGLCGCCIEEGLFKVVEGLGIIEPGDTSSQRKAARYVAKHCIRTGDEDKDLKIFFAGVEQPLEKMGIFIPLQLMQIVFSSSQEQMKRFGISIEHARRILWLSILRWQNHFFQKAPVKVLYNLVRKTQEALRESILGENETKGADLELYVLLESLLHPKENVRFRLSLPNVILLTDDGKHDKEYDVLSTILKIDNSVEIWIWGATTEDNYTKKRTQDLSKIQIFKDKIGQRWSGEIRTAVCYVHVQNNKLELEYNGRKESR